nr:hypothetical protein [Anabaena azotica]
MVIGSGRRCHTPCRTGECGRLNWTGIVGGAGVSGDRVSGATAIASSVNTSY